MESAGQPAKEGKIVSKLSLDVVTLTREAQTQHGLRQDDYERYRQYCARKMRRLRVGTSTTQKSKAKNGKPQGVAVGNVKEERNLQVVLFDAERAWAFAMELKEGAEDEPRKRLHMIKRLRRAVELAAHLDNLSSHLCDERSVLQTQAYSTWMKGVFALEQKRWDESHGHFSKAKGLYTKLSHDSQAQQAVLINAKLDEIEQFTTFTQRKRGSPAVSQGSSKTQAAEEEVEPQAKIQWEGRSHPVKNSRLAAKLDAIKDAEKDKDQALQAGGELDAQLQAFDRILTLYGEACQLAATDVKNDEAASQKVKSSKGEEHTASLRSIQRHLNYARLSLIVERTFFLATATRTRADSPFLQKPEELVRLYVNALQNLGEMKELSGDRDDAQSNEPLEAEAAYAKALSTFYAAMTFERAEKWAEAFALYSRSEEYMEEPSRSSFPPASKEPYARTLEELAKLAKARKTLVKAAGLQAPTQSDSAAATVPFLPQFQAIPCKPVFFDIADHFVEYPSVAHRAKKQAGITGLLSSFWGR